MALITGHGPVIGDTLPFAGPAARAYRGRRVLVLGATGFIGRWVAVHLWHAGAELTVTARDTKTASTILDGLGIDATIYRLDLLDLDRIRTVYRSVRPAITFNLAGYGVDPKEQDARTAAGINEKLPPILCAGASHIEGEWHGPRLIHAGSALEYGAATGDLREDTNPLPTTLYGRTKLAGTRALQEESARSSVNAVVARLFTVYGPGERAGRLLPSLIEAARTNTPVPLTSGRQRRDFSYVEDIAAALLNLGIAPTTPGEVVNLASGKLLPVRDFVLQAAQVLRLGEDHLRFGEKPTRGEEMSHNSVNINRLRDLIGTAPEADVAAGVKRTLDRLAGLGAPTQIPGR